MVGGRLMSMKLQTSGSEMRDIKEVGRVERNSRGTAVSLYSTQDFLPASCL